MPDTNQGCFMAFDSFDIRKITDNSRANLNEVDKLICDEFGLEFSDKDYGHFFFTESEEELGAFQKSISWAGLLHVIVYYSIINYGKVSNYDIEAAMTWIREYAVHFPHSATVFTTKLVKFLEEKGFYVFVNFHRDEDRNCNEYTNSYNSHMILKNESGVFECNDKGKLLRFYPDSQNLLDEAKVRETYTFGKSYYKPCIHSLIIPEGVTSLEHEFFRGGLVQDNVQLPNSLVSLGDKWNPCVFSDSCLPELIIPDNVNLIGEFAFGNSRIRSLRLTRVFESEYLRQFKGAYIETLFLPEACQQHWRQGFDGYAYLHMKANDVEFY